MPRTRAREYRVAGQRFMTDSESSLHFASPAPGGGHIYASACAIGSWSRPNDSALPAARALKAEETALARIQTKSPDIHRLRPAIRRLLR